jgi:hypothetical protein
VVESTPQSSSSRVMTSVGGFRIDREKFFIFFLKQKPSAVPAGGLRSSETHGVSLQTNLFITKGFVDHLSFQKLYSAEDGFPISSFRSHLFHGRNPACGSSVRKETMAFYRFGFANF